MSELDKLKSWMATNNLTDSQLADEMGISYINVYMCIRKRKRLSANFELRFRRRFGEKLAEQIFDAPALTERVTA